MMPAQIAIALLALFVACVEFWLAVVRFRRSKREYDALKASRRVYFDYKIDDDRLPVVDDYGEVIVDITPADETAVFTAADVTNLHKKATYFRQALTRKRNEMLETGDRIRLDFEQKPIEVEL
jgi:hypothetical protein